MEKKKNICSVCGKEYEYELQVTYKDGKATCRHDSECINDRWSIRRRQNYEYSMEALKMAEQQKRIDKEMGLTEKVQIVSTQKGSRGQVVTLPKKVVESLERKIEEQL